MSDMLQTAHTHRQNGDYEAAEAAYREVLACEPQTLRPAGAWRMP